MTRSMVCDRALRAFVGRATIVVAFIIGAGVVGGLVVCVAAPIVLAAVTGFCRTYMLTGISAHPARSRTSPTARAQAIASA